MTHMTKDQQLRLRIDQAAREFTNAIAEAQAEGLLVSYQILEHHAIHKGRSVTKPIFQTLVSREIE